MWKNFFSLNVLRSVFWHQNAKKNSYFGGWLRFCKAKHTKVVLYHISRKVTVSVWHGYEHPPYDQTAIRTFILEGCISCLAYYPCMTPINWIIFWIFGIFLLLCHTLTHGKDLRRTPLEWPKQHKMAQRVYLKETVVFKNSFQYFEVSVWYYQVPWNVRSHKHFEPLT